MSEQLPPGPWDIIQREGLFEVRTSSGEHIYIYYEDEPTRRAALRRFSREQAKRIALAIAKLPDTNASPEFQSAGSGGGSDDDAELGPLRTEANAP